MGGFLLRAHAGIFRARRGIISSDLPRKLGFKPGQTVCLLDAPQDTGDAIREAAPDGVDFVQHLSGAPCDLVLFWPQGLEGLEERFRQLQDRIDPDGAVWAIIPKKRFAALRGMDLTWEQVQQAALRTDLVDNKIASVSDQEYGTRFVIRKDRRDQYRKLGEPPPGV